MSSSKVKPGKPLLLIFPFDLLSHYLRCLVLARHLGNYFEVMFSHSEKYAGFVESEGYSTFDCKSLDSELVMERVKNFDFSWINKQNLETVFLEQVDVIAKLRPVAVLGDTSITLKMAAEKTGVTYISIMNAYMSKYYFFTRRLSRSHPLYKYLGKLPSPILDMLTRTGEMLAFQKLYGPFRNIRFNHGLSKQRSYLDELEGDINLVADLAELFPLRKLPGNYIKIAPLYFDTNVVYTQVIRKLDKNKKTIFVSMGSSGEWERLLFLNDRFFEKYNIITAGDNRKILNAANIIATPFINVHEIFHVVDLVICQGGNGTIYQSLLYGIPLLCKTNNFEQEWNVDALERLHVGRSLDRVMKQGEYASLVEEWIDKKASVNFATLKSKIKEENAKLVKHIRKMATGIIGEIVKDPQQVAFQIETQ